MIAMTASASHDLRASDIIVTLLGLLVMFGIGLVAQAKFKSGHAYLRYRDQNPARTDFMVRAGFAALPLLWFCGAGLLMVVFIALYRITGINFTGVLGAFSALALVPMFIWAAKEFWRPTRRRRPAWWDAYERR